MEQGKYISYLERISTQIKTLEKRKSNMERNLRNYKKLMNLDEFSLKKLNNLWDGKLSTIIYSDDLTFYYHLFLASKEKAVEEGWQRGDALKEIKERDELARKFYSASKSFIEEHYSFPQWSVQIGSNSLCIWIIERLLRREMEKEEYFGLLEGKAPFYFIEKEKIKIPVLGKNNNVESYEEKEMEKGVCINPNSDNHKYAYFPLGSFRDLYKEVYRKF
jgi:hypothetical protein